MKKIIIFFFLICCFVFFFFVSYKLQFSIHDLNSNGNRKESYKVSLSLLKENLSKNKLKCNRFKNSFLKKKTYNIHFKYPILFFRGMFYITEEFSFGKNLVFSRIIYDTTNFKSSFIVEDICYPINKNNSLNINTTFNFLEKSGHLYSWSFNEIVDLKEHKDTLNIKLLPENITYTGKKVIFLETK